MGTRTDRFSASQGSGAKTKSLITPESLGKVSVFKLGKIAGESKSWGFGHFVTDTRFKFEGTFAKDLKAGDVLGYIDPDTMELVESNEIGHRVVMVVPISLEDSELDEMYALPDDRPRNG